MKKLLVTGGACAGKTTSLDVIQNYLEEKRYKVIIVEETPTFLISNGINSETLGKMSFIELVVKTQLENERKYIKMYKKDENAILIFDGSPIDVMKFTEKEELENILKKYKLTYDELLNSYDDIIFLQTIAKKYPELYTNDNNKARLLDIDKAIQRNDILLNVYSERKDLNIIDCYRSTKTKNEMIIQCIDKIIK